MEFKHARSAISTANAFVLRSGVPVFLDIQPDTLNLGETKIEATITPKTRMVEGRTATTDAGW